MTLRRGLGPKLSALIFLALLVLSRALVIQSAHAQSALVAKAALGSFPLGLAYDSAKGEVIVADKN